MNLLEKNNHDTRNLKEEDKKAQISLKEKSIVDYYQNLKEEKKAQNQIMLITSIIVRTKEESPNQILIIKIILIQSRILRKKKKKRGKNLKNKEE